LLILVGRRYLFVGSLNLDPRSIDINAKMGLLINSAEMTGTFAEVIATSEPQAGLWLRFKAWVLRIGPESQL
jgi:putative cardiolipin synthase